MLLVIVFNFSRGFSGAGIRKIIIEIFKFNFQGICKYIWCVFTFFMCVRVFFIKNNCSFIGKKILKIYILSV